jgi:asparagine synthase (glutamine-hydrolysing)
MSILFGRWNFNGEKLATDYLLTVRAAFARYGLASGGEYSATEVHLLHLAPSQAHGLLPRARQPLVMPSGSRLLWDGRLDNRGDLVGRLGADHGCEVTDAEIVAAAYERWGVAALAQLVGDWALSVWDPREQTLLLAKDFLGARPLFYSVEKNSVTWSSLLDPLVLSAGAPFTLNEEYVAGWFSLFPAAHLTPYAGIQSVPSASYVQVRPRHATTERYWNFASDRKITYRDDRDYEEHFRTTFGESIRRRLRSDVPVLAELSGGMDSSSIVCMADRLMSRGFSETPRLDTLSYFDDSEPNWNEAPYFAQVERQRGRTGLHIPARSRTCLFPSFDPGFLAATPGSAMVTEENLEFLASVKSGRLGSCKTRAGPASHR